MPSFEQHCADCVREMGEPFEEVHEWLDEFFDIVGSDHRDIRHNEKRRRKGKRDVGR